MAGNEKSSDSVPQMSRESSILDAQSRMASVLAASEIGTWTYEIGPNRVVADRNLSRMFHVSEEEAAGGRMESYLRAIHGDDRPRVEETIGRAIESGEKFVSEYRLCGPDGSVRWVLARGSVERDGSGNALRLPGVILDITEKVLAEQEREKLNTELEKQSRVMDTLLSSMADFAYIFDRDGRFLYVNRALLQLWGLELKDAVGKNFFDLQYPDELASRLQQQIQEVIDTRQSVSDKTPYTSPTGESGAFEYIFWPVFAADGSVENVTGTTRNITEGERILAELKRSEENFRTLAETLPDGVWIADKDGSVTWMNSVVTRVTGLTSGTLPGNAYMDIIHEEDATSTRGQWHASLKSGDPLEIQHRIRQADGTWRWHLFRARASRDAGGAIHRWIGTSTDIHEQREVQSQLQRSEAEFRRMADTMPQIVWAAQPDGQLDYYSRRWYEYIGMNPGDAESVSWNLHLHPDDLGRAYEAWSKSIATGDPYAIEFRVKDAAGVYHWFLVRALPMREERGDITRWFGTCTDVSEQRHMMHEREELLASERAARSTAEHASRMKDEFLATLSHELRSPLNAIFGWTQLLRESEDDPVTLTEGLDVIDRNVRMQTQLIEDLLDMSRIISGKLRLDVQSVIPAACINAAIETVTPAANAKGIRIEKILDPRSGAISGDPGRIQQILWNLLSNAIKFTPRGGKVQVLLERVNSHLEISVADSGEGISPEFLPHVFDRFRQADGAANRKHGGLGLGLAIVKQLVELHGGSIRVRSEGAGKGATFVVHIPLKVVFTHTDDGERIHPQSPRQSPLFRKNTELEGIHVLIVDDEGDARDLLKRVLERSGAVVTGAASAKEALTLIPQLMPQVLVSDVGMPGMDGYEFIRQVRELGQEKGGNIPAVALTAFARSEDRTRALLAGFLAHVAKPVEPAELAATIIAVTGRARSGS